MIPKGDIPGICEDCGTTSRILKSLCKLIKNYWKNIDVQSVGILHWKHWVQIC